MKNHALFVCPTASQSVMRGSIGELTALVGLQRELAGANWHVEFAECVRAADSVPHVDQMLRSLSAKTLFHAVETGNERSYIRDCQTKSLLSRPSVDVVVLSTLRAFFQYPKFPSTISLIVDECRKAGVAVVALDPCGDSFCCSTPDMVANLMPVPFSYREPLRDDQFACALSNQQVRRHRGGRGWLWAGAPWMADFPRYLAAEQVFLQVSAHLDLPLCLLSPVNPNIPSGNVKRVDESLPYDELEREVSEFDVLITANRRSVLAARAASMGMPVVWFNPGSLEEDVTFGDATNGLLRAIKRDNSAPTPIPLEFSELACSSFEEGVEALKQLLDLQPELRERQRDRLHTYGTADHPSTVLQSVVSRRP